MSTEIKIVTKSISFCSKEAGMVWEEERKEREERGERPKN